MAAKRQKVSMSLDNSSNAFVSVRHALENMSETKEDLIHKNANQNRESPSYGNISLEIESALSETEKNEVKNLFSQYPQATEALNSLLRVLTPKLLNQHKQFHSQSQLTPNNHNQKAKDSLISANEGNKSTIEANLSSPITDSHKICTFSDLSFTKPRKKLDMDVFTGGLRIRQKDKVEVELNMSMITRVICVSTPTQVKKQSSLLIFYQTVSNKEDVVVFSFLDQGKLKLDVMDSSLMAIDSEDNKSTILSLSKDILHQEVIQPNLAVFQSTKRESYVDCYMKTKDGQLFLLAQGILFGLKPPIIWIPTNQIDQINISNQTSRTFGLDIQSKDQTVNEFQMIEESEKQGITNYIQRLKNLKQNSHENEVANTNLNNLSSIVGNGSTGNEFKAVHTLTKGERKSSRVKKPASHPVAIVVPDGSDEEEEEDDTFQPIEDENIPEEYDSQVEQDDSEKKESSEEEQEQEQEQEHEEEQENTKEPIVISDDENDNSSGK